MWFYLFCILAALSFTGFYLNARASNGPRMAYSFVLLLVWVGLALYSGGYLNG